MSSGTIGPFVSTSAKYYKTWGGSNSPPGGPLTENPYSMTGIRGNKFGKIGIYSTTTGKWLQDLDPGWPSTKTVPAGNTGLDALADLANAVRGHSFDLGNALGEGRQTVGMALSTISKFGRTAKNLRSGNLEGAFRSLFGTKPPPRSIRKAAKRKLERGDIAGTWLEMQYGWLPLMSDVYESGKAWSAIADQARKNTYKGSASSKAWLNHSPMPTKFEYGGAASNSVRVKCTVKEQLSAPRSLGLLDPVGVAWELTPWSFVVDWFLPIGDYLDVLSVLPPTVVEKVVTSRRVRSPCSFTSILDKKAGASSEYRQKNFRLGYVYLQLTRTVSTTVSVPLPKFENPWAAMGKGNRIYNAVALASQFFKKK